MGKVESDDSISHSQVEVCAVTSSDITTGQIRGILFDSNSIEPHYIFLRITLLSFHKRLHTSVLYCTKAFSVVFNFRNH